MLQKIRSRTWLKRFYLEEDGGQVTLSKLVLKRMRVVLVVSLLTNGLLFWGWARSLNGVQGEQLILEQAGHLAQHSKALAELYGAQIEDLTLAYALYGDALTGPESERNKNYAAHKTRLQAFNERSLDVAAISTHIRDRANRIAGLLERREP